MFVLAGLTLVLRQDITTRQLCHNCPYRNSRLSPLHGKVTRVELYVRVKRDSPVAVGCRGGREHHPAGPSRSGEEHGGAPIVESLCRRARIFCVAENNGQSMSTNWKRLLKVNSNPLASSTSYSFFLISSFFTVCLG